LQVIDVSNPVSPKRVGENPAFDTFDLIVAGNNAFLAGFEDGLIILDLLRPSLRLEP